MTMIRKQLYIAPEQQEKLRRLAAQWKCTESAVMRTALDRLPVYDDSIYDNPVTSRLAFAGLLVPPPEDGEVLSEDELEALEREMDEWSVDHPEPLRLAEAVLQDRGPW